MTRLLFCLLLFAIPALTSGTPLQHWRLLRTIHAEDWGTAPLALSPDGGLLASRMGRDIVVRNAVTGRIRNRLPAPPLDPAARLFFSPDGHLLALAGSEHPYSQDVRAAAAFSPDRRTLALGGGAVAFLWDMTTGRETQIGPDPDLPFGTARYRTKFTFWDLGTNRLLWKADSAVPGPWSQAISLAFSPDGRQIVSGSAGGGLQTWDGASGAPLRSFTAPPDAGHSATALARQGGVLAHSGRVVAVAFSPDGRILVSAGGDGRLRTWDPDTGVLRRTVLSPVGVQAFAFRPDGRTLVAAFRRDIAVLDVPSGRVLTTLYGHDEDVQSLALTPDGDALWSGAADGTIKRWDLARGVAVATFGRIRQAAVSGDGTTLAYSLGDSDVTVEQLSGRGARRTLSGLSRPERAGSFSQSTKTLALSPDGRTLVGGGFTTEGFVDHAGVFRSRVVLWDARRVQPVHVWPDDPASGLNVSPDGRLLVETTADLTDTPGLLRVRAVPGGRMVRDWHSDAGGGAPFGIRQGEIALSGAAVVFGPGRHLLLATTGPVHGTPVPGLWNVPTGRSVRTLAWGRSRLGAAGTPVSAAAGGGFVADGELPRAFDSDKAGRLVAGVGPGGVALWDVGTGRRRWIRPLVPGPGRNAGPRETFVAISPDGRWLASSEGPDGWVGAATQTPVFVSEGASGRVVAQLDGMTGGLSWLSFSPDGRLLFTASGDGAVRIWGISQ